MLKKVSIFVATVIVFVSGLSLPHYANASNESSGGLPFIAEPILPSNQDEGIESYISITPKEDSIKQEIQFLLKNETDAEQTIEAEVVDAYTSSNGVVEYVKSDTKDIIDENYMMTNHLTLDQTEYTLQSGEEQIITTNIDVDKMDGTLLGGIRFKSLKDETETVESEGSSFQINNEINRVIGVIVQFEQKSEEVDVSVDEPFIEPMPSYYVVKLPTTMNTPILKSLSMTYELSDEKGKKLFDGNKEISFAPKTKADISIPWDFEEIDKGATYNLKGSFTYTDDKEEEHVIDFDKSFKYDGDKKEKGVSISDFAPPSESGSGFNPLWLILLIIPIGIFAFLFIRNKKKGTKDDKGSKVGNVQITKRKTLDDNKE